MIGFVAIQDIAVNKLERHSLSNTVRCVSQAKITKLTPY